MGGVQNSSGNSGGVGPYFSGQKLEIPGRRGGLREIPSAVGVWIFSGTTHSPKGVLGISSDGDDRMELKSRPKKIPRASSKTHKNPWTKN